ncbi:MAG TPA: hypothetical protein VH539_00660 [Gemmatimonadaceae bacterium]
MLLTAFGRARAQDAIPADWVGVAIGAGEISPCCVGGVALSGEWLRHLAHNRYVAVRLNGVIGLDLYDGGGPTPPTNKLGEIAGLYGLQWRGRWLDARLGTGVALGTVVRVHDVVVTYPSYVGVPLDAQIAVHFCRICRLTFGGFGTLGGGVRYRAAVFGLELGWE